VKGQQVYLGYIGASAADVFSIVSALRLKERWNHGRIATRPPLLVARMRNLLELKRPVFRLNIGATRRAPREEKHKGLLGQIA
jgi:hypothetical protein